MIVIPRLIVKLFIFTHLLYYIKGVFHTFPKAIILITGNPFLFGKGMSCVERIEYTRKVRLNISLQRIPTHL